MGAGTDEQRPHQVAIGVRGVLAQGGERGLDGGVSAFPDALLMLFEGENVGKLVLRVGSD